MSTNKPGGVWRARLLGGLVTLSLCAISGVIGGVIVSDFASNASQISYVEFISIILTAISLLITILAIFLAILGVVGWTSIEPTVHSKTEEFLSHGLSKGERLDRLVTERVEQAILKKTEEIMFKGVEGVDGIANQGEDNSSDPEGRNDIISN